MVGSSSAPEANGYEIHVSPNTLQRDLSLCTQEVSHNLGNILSVIQARSVLLQTTNQDRNQYVENLTEISKAAHRTAEFIDRFLSIQETQKELTHPIQLDQLLYCWRVPLQMLAGAEC